MSQNAPTSAFLQRIHHLDERYRYLDQLYVKPREYDHIVQILETHGVVFIVGDPLIGKTYTAAYLMYQYFKKGYDPVWVEDRGGASTAENDEVSDSADRVIQQIEEGIFVSSYERFLRERTVVYIEDPFGKHEKEETRVRRSRVVDIRNLVHQVVELTHRFKDVYVIVTSREGIFERALAEDASLREYVVNLRESLRAAEPGHEEGSYGDAARQQVFANYVALFKPAWADDGQRASAIGQVALCELYAPHAIEVFIRRTRAIVDSDQIRQAIIGQPAEFVQIYARQINELPRTHQLFLVLVSVLERTSHLIDFIYGYVLGRLDSKFRFEKRGKLAYSESREECRLLGLVEILTYDNMDAYGFAHPIYSEAVEEYIATYGVQYVSAVITTMEEFRTQKLKRIIHERIKQVQRGQKMSFQKGLRAMQPIHKAPFVKSPKGEDISASDTWHPEPSGAQKRLTPNDEYLLRNDIRMLVRRLAEIIIVRYTEMPNELQARLPILAGDPNKWMREQIVRGIGENIGSLPRAVQDLLLLFVDDPVPRVRLALLDVLGEHFQLLPQKVHDLLVRLCSDRDALVQERATGIISENFNAIPFPGLVQLARHPSVTVRTAIAGQLVNSPVVLPEEGHLLLCQLAGDESERVRRCIQAGLEQPTCLVSDNTRCLMELLLNARAVDVGRRIAAAHQVWHERMILPLAALDVWKILARDSEPLVRAEIAQLVLMAANKYHNAMPTQPSPDSIASLYAEAASDLSLLLSKDPSLTVRERVLDGLLTFFHFNDSLFIQIAGQFSRDSDDDLRLKFARLIWEHAEMMPPDMRAGWLFAVEAHAPDPWKRVCAVRQIESMVRESPTPVLEQLHDLARDENPLVRREVARLTRKQLWYLPTGLRAELPLLLINDPHPAVRLHAAAALVEMAANSPLTSGLSHALETLVQDTNPHVRALVGCRLLQNHSALPAGLVRRLVTILCRDSDPRVRNRLLEMLANELVNVGRWERQSYNVLLNASNRNPEVRRATAEIISRHYPSLLPDARNILASLIRDPAEAVQLAALEAAERHLAELTPSAIASLADCLHSPHVTALQTLSRMIVRNYSDLGMELQQILWNGYRTKDRNVRKAIAESLGEYYQKLPSGLPSILSDLLEDKDVSVVRTTIGAMIDNYEYLPHETLGKLRAFAYSPIRDLRAALLDALGRHYDRLPLAERELFGKLAAQPEMAAAAILTIGRNYSVMPVPMRQAFLSATTGTVEVRDALAEAIVENYDRLPMSERAFLHVLKTDFENQVRETLGSHIMLQYHHLPSEVQQIALELSIDRSAEVRRAVAAAFIRHYWQTHDVAPTHLLQQFLDDESPSVVGEVAFQIVRYYYRLPTALTQLIKERFATDRRSIVRAELLAAILYHFTELPSDVRALLYDLARDKHPKLRMRLYRILTFYEANLPNDIREILLMYFHSNNPNPDSRVRTVREISQRFDRFPTQVQDLLVTFVNDRVTSVRRQAAAMVAEHYGELENKLRHLIVNMAGDSDGVVIGHAIEIVERAFFSIPVDALVHLIIPPTETVTDAVLAEIRMAFSQPAAKTASWREQVVNAFETRWRILSDPIRSIILEAIDDPNERVSDAALNMLLSYWAVIGLHNRSIVVRFMERLGGPPGIRTLAAITSRWRELPMSLQQLWCRWAKSPVVEVRQLVVQSLRQAKPWTPEMVEVLTQAMHDTSLQVRTSVVDVIGSLPEFVDIETRIRWLTVLARDENETISQKACSLMAFFMDADPPRALWWMHEMANAPTTAMIFHEIQHKSRNLRASRIALAFAAIADVLTQEDPTSIHQDLKVAMDFLCEQIGEAQKVQKMQELRDFYGLVNSLLTPVSLPQIISRCRSVAGTAIPRAIVQSIADSFQCISRIGDNLRDTTRVTSWGDKLYYLERASAELAKARSYLIATPGLVAEILSVAVENWRQLIVDDQRSIERRADLEPSLRVQEAVCYQTQVTIPLSVLNKGLANADSVCVILLPHADFEIVDNGQRDFTLIQPGKTVDTEFTVRPLTQASRLQVEFKIGWDDTDQPGKAAKHTGELRVVRPDRTFVRIWPNPYVVGPAIAPGKATPFVGRSDLVDWLADQLGGLQLSVIVLHGQTRIGKTSALLQLAGGMLGERLRERLQRQISAVYIDLHELAETGTHLFLQGVARQISAHPDIDLPPPSLSDFREAPYTLFDTYLTEVTGHLGSNLLLLMFDEFEALEKRVKDGKVDADIYDYLRHQMQFGRNVGFILTGTHELGELTPGHWNILANIARHREISVLTYQEAVSLICTPVAPTVHYDDLAIEKVWRITGGHPYFTQLLCQDIINAMNAARKSNYITIEDINAAVDHLLTSGGHEMMWLWNDRSSSEQAILTAMAELAGNGQEGVLASDLTTKLTGTGLSAAEIVATLDRLRTRKVLRVAPEDLGDANDLMYAFCVDLFRLWLLRRQHLGTVISLGQAV